MDSRRFPCRQNVHHYYEQSYYNTLPERYYKPETYSHRPISMIALSNLPNNNTMRRNGNLYKKNGYIDRQQPTRGPPPSYYQTILNKERSQKSYSIFNNMISSSQSLADIHLATILPNPPNHYQHLERTYNPVIIAAARKHNMPINSHYPSSSTHFPVSCPSTSSTSSSTSTDITNETSFVESQRYRYRRNSLAEAYNNAIQLPELSLYEKTPSTFNLSTQVSFYCQNI